MTRIVFIVLLTFTLSVSQVFGMININAQGAILIEPTTGTILYGKNIHQQFYPASTTKLLTSLILLENMIPNEVITKSQASVNNVPSDSSQIFLNVGDKYTYLDGLYAILMESDNFVSYDMAIHKSGSIQNFASLMNYTAQRFGAYNSNFVNPHGYHDPNHYTTPYDLAFIARACFSNPYLVNIASTPTYAFNKLNNGTSIILENSSEFFNPNSNNFNPNVVASKTGYHTPAGYTLVSKVEYDNISLIGVILKGTKSTRFEDMNTMFEYGRQNFNLSYKNNIYKLENISYSDSLKPFIEYALNNNWIYNTTKNYQSSVTSKEFIEILINVFPEIDPFVFFGMLPTTIPSIYKEEIYLSKERLEEILLKTEKYFSLNQSFLNSGILNQIYDMFQIDNITYEEAIAIIYYFKNYTITSIPYVFNSNFYNRIIDSSVDVA
ncbi:hypothetical protein AN639_02640 [Candidatus Epulonipiscium fishelsonii]|nr:hypothetical protein AN639_02640 [Epulopiscium sp. SCG-B05WGA-EpuloA1]